MTDLIQALCLWCGKEITAKNGRKPFCSPSHRSIYYHTRQKRRRERRLNKMTPEQFIKNEFDNIENTPQPKPQMINEVTIPYICTNTRRMVVDFDNTRIRSLNIKPQDIVELKIKIIKRWE